MISTLLSLYRHFPDGSPVIRALRQDPIVWDSILNTDLGVKAITTFSPDPMNWSPGALALLDADIGINLSRLLEHGHHPLPSSITSKSETYLENWLSNNHRDFTLQDLGIIGLNLREKFITHSSWNWLEGYIRFDDPHLPTVISCLYSYINNPENLVEFLLTSEAIDSDLGKGLVEHVLACQPSFYLNYAGILFPTLDTLTENQKLEILTSFYNSFPEIVKDYCSKEITRIEKKVHIHKNKNNFKNISDRINLVDIQNVLAEFQKLSGNTTVALDLSRNSAKTLNVIQSEISAGIARTSDLGADNHERVQYWKEAVRLNPVSIESNLGLITALIDQHEINEAEALIKALKTSVASNNDPHIFVTEALIEKELGNTKKALEIIESVLEIYPTYGDDEHLLSKLAKLLWQLNEDEKSLRLALRVLEINPNAFDMLNLVSEIYYKRHDHKSALKYQMFSIINNANGKSNYELIIENLEQLGEWEEAFNQYQAYFPNTEDLSRDELTKFAWSALKAGEFEESQRITSEILENDPKDSSSLIIKGLSFLFQNKSQDSLASLNQAVDCDPYSPIGWLALSNYYKQRNDFKTQSEILLKAAQLTDDSPEVHLELGKLFQSNSAPSQAITHFDRAFSCLINQSMKWDNKTVLWLLECQTTDLFSETTLSYKNSLEILGRLDNIGSILETAYQEQQKFGIPKPDISYAYAKFLIDNDQPKDALEPLKFVTLSNPDSYQSFIDYSRILLSESSDPRSSSLEIIPKLELIKSSDVNNPEVSALLAEAYSYSGKHSEAIEGFKSVIEDQIFHNNQWKSRLSIAFARSSLELNNPELCIASLTEAQMTDPENTEILQLLSEAYLKCGLAEDAIQSAKNALIRNRDNIKLLEWFADMVLDLEDIDSNLKQRSLNDAVNTLRHAVNLFPDRINLIVKLFQAYQKVNDPLSAQNLLEELSFSTENLKKLTNDTGLNEVQESIDILVEYGELSNAISIVDFILCDESGFDLSCENQVQILEKSIHLHSSIGSTELALERVERLLAVEPGNSRTYIIKVDLLYQSGLYEECVETLKKAHTSIPTDKDILFKLIEVQIMIGNLGDIEFLIERIIKLLDQNPSNNWDVWKLQEIKWMTGLNHNPILIEQSTDGSIIEASIQTLCLKAEIALWNGDFNSAVRFISDLEEFGINNVRVRALLSLRFALQGDWKSSKDLYQTAVEDLDIPLRNNNQYPSIERLTDWRILSYVGLLLGEYELSGALISSLCNNVPSYLRNHLLKAEFLVNRAQYQQICEHLHIVNNSPGGYARYSHSYREFIDSIERVEELNKYDSNNDDADTSDYISSKQLHGRLIFSPSSENRIPFDSSEKSDLKDVSLASAFLMTQANKGDLESAVNIAYLKKDDPEVLLALSIAFSESNPQQALGSAYRLVEQISNKNRYSLIRPPLAFALVAYLTKSITANKKQIEFALNSIQNALNEWENEPSWHRLASDLLMNNYQDNEPVILESAIKHLEHAVHYDPNNLDHYKELGRLSIHRDGRMGAVSIFEKASIASPDSPESWLALAEAQRDVGDYGKALQSVDKAEELTEDLTEAYILKAEIALENDQPDQAYSLIYKVLEIEPENPKALLVNCLVLEKLDRFGEALSTIQKILEKNKSLEYELIKIRLMIHSEYYKEALNDIQSLIDHGIENSEIRTLYALTLIKMGNIENAKKHALLAVQGQGDQFSNRESSEIHRFLGEVGMVEGDLHSAVKHLEIAVKNAPNDLGTYMTLASLYEKEGDLEKALEVYEIASTLNPEDYQSHFKAGIIFRTQKDYIKAEAYLKKANELAPGNVQVHRMLAGVTALNFVHNRNLSTYNMGSS